ncbi:hypothetical protein ACFV5G_19570 [Streptomyces sp. NPDC059766]|uniref:hypothetical protein n=1 Tax=Streptomyces sp. NPDC059766 TaxID=3346940 RepID=UPI0036575FE9
MDIARCLTTIDLLCTRDLHPQHGRTDAGTSGPGYLVAVLQTSGEFWEDDGTERDETGAQYEHDRDGLTERLTARWGEPQRFSLASVFDRVVTGEEIPEPWALLASHVPDLHLWRPPGTERWLALGVSQWDKELPYQLIAVVTDVDPP